MDALTTANLLAWSLQAGVIVLVAAPLPRLLGLWSPRVRMAYWRAVLVACLLLPLLQPWVVRQAPPALEVEATAEVVAGTANPATAATSAAPLASLPFWRRALPIDAAAVLVAGALLRLGWLGLGVITVGRLRRSARRLWPRPEAVDRAATLAETDAEFLVSATASRPVTCGVLWPVVLVPRTFESFPEHEQMAIACHELLHVNRSDWLRNAIDEVVRAVLWFHPPIWWLINQIQLAREQVVDREAVRRLGARQAYLEALLRMARPAPRLILSPATLFLKRAHLRQRVTLLVKEVSMSKARLAATLVVMAAVIVIGGSFATSAFPLQQAGAAKPGMATPEPKIDWLQPVTLKLSEGISVRQALTFVAQTARISITYEPGLDQALDMAIGPIETKDVNVLLAISQILGYPRLAFRVVGDRAIFVSAKLPAAGGPGGVTGAARPGVSTGTGSGIGAGGGSGVGGGRSTGVSGGVSGGVTGGVRGGVSGGVSGGVTGGVTTGAAASDVAPWRTTWPQDAIRVGGNIKPPTKLVDVKPVYPAIAQSARVQGVVICEVLIGSDGKVADAHILRSIPLLDQAALDAVTQWEFATTLLNGNPVPVIMTVTVNFTLDGGTPDLGLPVRDTATQQAAAVIEQYAAARQVAAASGFLVKYGQATDWPPEAIRVGANLKAPTRIMDVKPVYPEVAQKARVQGIVICEVLVRPDGTVADARVLRSIPLLDQAAFDAVLQWVFTPTLLNGNAVPIIMTVTVNFTLE
jgi:TonB family protein